MSAALLLSRLYDLGAEVAAEGSELVVKAPPGSLAPNDVEELRHRKLALLGILAGELCAFCEGAIDWRRPNCVAFADGTGAHLGCYEEAEVARLLAAARRAVNPALAADPAEVMLRGEADLDAAATPIKARVSHEPRLRAPPRHGSRLRTGDG